MHSSPRLDKACPVYLSTEAGLSRAVLCGLTRAGASVKLYLEAGEALRPGERLTVTFDGEDGTEVHARCQVRGCIALVRRARDWPEPRSYLVGLEVVAFEAEGAPPSSVERTRAAH